mgnify:FL=1
MEGRRVQMINVSSAMGGQFAWSAAELTEEIRQMGSNPLKRSPKQPLKMPPARSGEELLEDG